MAEQQKIDFVIPWVDGSDAVWQKDKAQYAPSKTEDDRTERYRDWGSLHYLFRGIERFAPWVRTVHLITWGHLPKWLNRKHPKLHIVNHRDFIPEAYLPTFNVNPIELNMHRIEGLSEQFVYLNDDLFFLKDVKPTDFFRDGKPCDMLAFQPVVANPANPVMSHIYMNNALVLSKHFQKRENVRMQPRNYFKAGYPCLYFFYNLLELAFPLFTGFYTVHGAAPFLRSTFEAVWEAEREVLEETSTHRFRSEKDHNQYLMREWQKLSGNFHACNPLRNFRYFNIGNENAQLLRVIERQSVKMICVNDANVPIEFERVKRELNAVFEKVLPEKSGFEI